MRQGDFTWMREQPLHATFDLYDRRAKETMHTRIYWSVREDGAYHSSWDNVDWNKYINWST